MKKLLVLMAIFAMVSVAVAAPITSVTKYDYSGRLGSSWDWDKSLDGDAGTFWYSNIGGATIPFITYEFDQAYQIGDVAITMSNGNFRKLATAGISVSTDGVNFTAAGNFTIDVTNGVVTTFNLANVSAKYVRVDGVEAFYSNWNPQYVTFPADASVDRYGISFADITFDAVPEPATMAMLAMGSLALIRRRH